jgi:hypothetical protein
MTRLPSRPTLIRPRTVEFPAPPAQPQRSRGRTILRWFFIVLLPFAIVAVLFLVIALVSK